MLCSQATFTTQNVSYDILSAIKKGTLAKRCLFHSSDRENVEGNLAEESYSRSSRMQSYCAHIKSPIYQTRPQIIQSGPEKSHMADSTFDGSAMSKNSDHDMCAVFVSPSRGVTNNPACVCPTPSIFTWEVFTSQKHLEVQW